MYYLKLPLSYGLMQIMFTRPSKLEVLPLECSFSIWPSIINLRSHKFIDLKTYFILIHIWHLDIMSCDKFRFIREHRYCVICRFYLIYYLRIWNSYILSVRTGKDLLTTSAHWMFVVLLLKLYFTLCWLKYLICFLILRCIVLILASLTAI